MPNQAVVREALLDPGREQLDRGKRSENLSSTTRVVHPETERRERARPKAGVLALAAAPTFAIMALLTGIQSGGMPDMLCSAAHDGSPLTGMVPMYLLMSAFHSAPWLALIGHWRRGARQT